MIDRYRGRYSLHTQLNMTTQNDKVDNLPSFKKPPLSEVVLSVQFEPLHKMQSAQIGVLWSTVFRSKYPHTEQHPKINETIERFGEPEHPAKELIKLDLSGGPDTPRCWFISEDGTELIQIQQDRLLHNWRKTRDEDGYPRYEAVRAEFSQDLQSLYSFVEKENIGAISPNQCEVTYINHIVTNEGWQDHSELSKIVPSWNPTYSDDFLSEPENTKIATQYIFNTPNDNEPWGRLYINVQPAFYKKDNQPVYTMTLTARGHPLTPDIDGVLQFLNSGRENIVRAFTSITSSGMHKVWEKE